MPERKARNVFLQTRTLGKRKERLVYYIPTGKSDLELEVALDKGDQSEDIP